MPKHKQRSVTVLQESTPPDGLYFRAKSLQRTQKCGSGNGPAKLFHRSRSRGGEAHHMQAHGGSPTAASMFRLSDASNGRDSLKSRGSAQRHVAGRCREWSTRSLRARTAVLTACAALASIARETSLRMATYLDSLLAAGGPRNWAFTPHHAGTPHRHPVHRSRYLSWNRSAILHLRYSTIPTCFLIAFRSTLCKAFRQRYGP